MLASLLLADVIALLALAAFVAWGAVRRTLSQLLGLGVLAGALALAARLGPRLEDVVVKAVSVPPADRQLLAWAVAFALALLGGGLGLALLRPLLARARLAGRADAWVGGALGLVHGAVVLSVIAYAVLLAHEGRAASRGIRDLERSASAQAARGVSRALRGVLPLPHWLERRARAIDERIARSAGRPAAERPARDRPRRGAPRRRPVGRR